MRKTVSVLLSGFIGAIGVQGTSIAPMPLADLVKSADHVVVGTVVEVDMVGADGQQVTDEKARTGPGLENEIRLRIRVPEDGVLKSSLKEFPRDLVVPIWRNWIHSLGQWKKEKGQSLILFLKGSDHRPVTPAQFLRPATERQEIESLIREQRK